MHTRQSRAIVILLLDFDAPRTCCLRRLKLAADSDLSVTSNARNKFLTLSLRPISDQQQRCVLRSGDRTSSRSIWQAGIMQSEFFCSFLMHNNLPVCMLPHQSLISLSSFDTMASSSRPSSRPVGLWSCQAMLFGLLYGGRNKSRVDQSSTLVSPNDRAVWRCCECSPPEMRKYWVGFLAGQSGRVTLQGWCHICKG